MQSDSLRSAARVVVLALGATYLSACGNSPDAEPIPGADASQGAGGARPDGAVPGARDAIAMVELEASSDARRAGDAPGDQGSSADAGGAARADAPDGDAERSDAAACGCVSYGAPSPTGPLRRRSSSCRGHREPPAPGVLYAHNDSGASASVVVFSDTAAPLGEIALSNVTAVDWEDIAVGPCAAGSCVYVGDIGDNALAYPSRAVYRFAEPDISPSTSIGSVTATAEIFPYVYPDDRHNAETLLVEPTTGDIFIVTKVADTQSAVYRMPQPLTPGRGDARADRPALAFRRSWPGGRRRRASLRHAHAHSDVPAGVRVQSSRGAAFASIFATIARPVPTPTQEQESKGEGVTYASDGFGYFTASELDGKASRSLYRVRCP